MADTTSVTLLRGRGVLDIDTGSGWVDVEGMTTYADLVDATLPQGLAPAVVPELKSITVGGATSPYTIPLPTTGKLFFRTVR